MLLVYAFCSAKSCLQVYVKPAVLEHSMCSHVFSTDSYYLALQREKHAGSISAMKCEPWWLLRNKRGCKNTQLLCWASCLREHAGSRKSSSIKVNPFLKPLALLWVGSPNLAECFNLLLSSNKIHTHGTRWVLILFYYKNVTKQTIQNFWKMSADMGVEARILFPDTLINDCK